MLHAATVSQKNVYPEATVFQHMVPRSNCVPADCAPESGTHTLELLPVSALQCDHNQYVDHDNEPFSKLVLGEIGEGRNGANRTVIKLALNICRNIGPCEQSFDSRTAQLHCRLLRCGVKYQRRHPERERVRQDKGRGEQGPTHSPQPGTQKVKATCLCLRSS